MLIEYGIKIEGTVKFSGAAKAPANVQKPTQPPVQLVQVLPTNYPGGLGIERGGEEGSPVGPGGGPDSRLSISFTITCPCEDGVQQVAGSTATTGTPPDTN